MIKTAIGHSEDPDSLAAIDEVLAQCHATLADYPPQAGILFAGIDFEHELLLQRIHQSFPDIALIGGTIVEHLQQALGPHIPIFGGATGDQWRFQQTYQFCGTQVFSDAVPILLLAGDVCFSYGAVSGWTPISQAGIVTKSHGPTLYEIDGQPALEFYRRYLGNLPPSGEYPLAVFATEGSDFCLQGCVTYDPKLGSVTFFDHIPEQAIAKLTKASRDEILAASRTSFMHALETYPGTEPEVALFFSCGARRYLLGTRTQEEHQLIHTCLPHPIPYIGLYSYGEIAPAGYNSAGRIHNMTFVTLLLGSGSNYPIDS